MPVRPGLWPALAIVVAGHGVVLTQLSATPPPAPRGQAGPPPVFQVRPLLPAAAPGAPEPATVAAVASAMPSLEAAAAPAPGSASAPAASPAVALAPEASATAPAPGLASQPATAPQPEPPYIPRGELTVAPRLLAAVNVPFPEEVTGVVDLAVQVSLFIDEQGAVRQVRVETPGVHAAFQRAIHDAFASARFSPGELQSVAVRSRLRVEVEFHAPSGRR